MSETIIINDGTNNFTDYAEITSSIKLFNKQTKRTLRRKVYSNWTGSYKTFGLSFDKIIKLNFDILKLIFESVTSKTFTFRGIAYKIIIIGNNNNDNTLIIVHWYFRGDYTSAQ